MSRPSGQCKVIRVSTDRTTDLRGFDDIEERQTKRLSWAAVASDSLYGFTD